MKKYFTAFGTISLLFLLSFGQSHAANPNSQITKEEAALWEKTFGEKISTEPVQKKLSTSQKPSKSASISGSWVGYYEYDKPNGQPAGMFHAIIEDLGGQFLITFLEPRNYPEEPEEYVQWAANSTAKRQGKYIEFTKSYGHNDTKIQYNLTISHNGTIMDGTWKIDGNTYGRAFFFRLNLQNLKNIKKDTVN